MRKRPDHGDATSCLGNTGERTTRKTLGYLELSTILLPFRVSRHLLLSALHRLLRTRAVVEWDAVTCAC